MRYESGFALLLLLLVPTVASSNPSCPLPGHHHTPDPRLCVRGSTDLSGVVRDAEGEPVPRAEVFYMAEVWDEECRFTQKRGYGAIADSLGRYSAKIVWTPSANGVVAFRPPRSEAPWERLEVSFQAGPVVFDHHFRDAGQSPVTSESRTRGATNLPWDGSWSPCMLDTVRIRGVIRNHDGAALPGAVVTYAGMKWREDCRGGQSAHLRGETDSTGNYEITGPGGFGYLAVEHLGRRAALRVNSLLVGDIRADYQFERFHIRGRVIGPNGQPISSGKVIYYRANSGCISGSPEATIADGAFDIVLSHRGTYVLWTLAGAEIPGVPWVWPRIEVDGDTTVTIQLGEHRVEGVVRNRDGTVLQGAHVQASGLSGTATVKSDSTGQYSLYLLPGSYQVSVRAKEAPVYEWMPIAPVEVQRSLRLDLQISTVEWSGVVRRADSNAPLDSISVFARGAGSALTDSNGKFRLAVTRGVPTDLEFSDARTKAIPMTTEVLLNWEAHVARYSRVKRLQVAKAASLSDSTFDIVLEPLEK
jgi:hypothetical protein